MNNVIRLAKNNQLKKTFARKNWQDYDLFFHWAVWAYLSGDSKHQGDAELLTMMQTWLDKLFIRLQTKPAKLTGKNAKNWTPNKISSWNFQRYSIPLMEIEQDSKAVSIIGQKRLNRLRQILLFNLKEYTPEVMKTQLKKNGKYINMLYHPFPMYLSYWLMTGNRNALDFCEKTNEIALKQLLPNGAFPYRYHLYGKRHCETDTMYYHAVNIRGIYLHWWYSGSKTAKEILKKSIPYYPLILEPPYHFSSGADLWWKDQWRTFWSQHVAMVAAASMDGENAAIARRMGKARKSLDWFDAVVGAHAFRLMAEEKIKSKPQRDNYIMKDPDIRGLRSRWGNWSSIFTAGSYSFTRMSGMLTNGRKYSALHLARPIFRVKQYASKPYRIAPGVYSTLGRFGAESAIIANTKVAVAGTSYHQALNSKTWRPTQPESPWLTNELWLIIPNGAIGLIDSTLGKNCTGYEISHQFRFICKEFGQTKKSNAWYADNMLFRVWETNFKYEIPERARRYVFDTKRRLDYQFTLSDSKRSPLETIYAKDNTKTKMLPQKKNYEKGIKYFSLVSITPDGHMPVKVKLIQKQKLITFSVIDNNSKKYLVAYNPTPESIAWALPKKQLESSSIMISGIKIKNKGCPPTIPAKQVGLAVIAK
jgi:hypothetical protein